MLDILAGLVIFLLLLFSKYSLSRVLLWKKQVALTMALIVTSELFIVLLLYIFIDKYKLSGIKIVIGFIGTAVLFLAFCGIKELIKVKNTEDGKF